VKLFVQSLMRVSLERLCMGTSETFRAVTYASVTRAIVYGDE